MSADVLCVTVAGRQLGRVERDRKKSRMRFVYEDEWRSFRSAFALSLSMPLAVAEHVHSQIGAFLWGLLPDQESGLDAERTLSRVARLAERVPDAVDRTVSQAQRDGLVHPVVESLGGQLVQNTRRCLQLLDR